MMHIAPKPAGMNFRDPRFQIPLYFGLILYFWEPVRLAAFIAVSTVAFMEIVRLGKPGRLEWAVALGGLLAMAAVSWPPQTGAAAVILRNYPLVLAAGACLAAGAYLAASQAMARLGISSAAPPVVAAASIVTGMILARSAVVAHGPAVETAAGVGCMAILWSLVRRESFRAVWAGRLAPAGAAIKSVSAVLADWPDAVWLSLALLVSLALTAIGSPGTLGTYDEASCFAAAHYFLHPGATPWSYASALIADASGRFLFDVAAFRLSLTLPATAVYWLSGERPGAVNLVFVGYQLALVTLTFLAGRRLFGRTTAVMAAFFAASSPLTFLFSSTPWPETAMAFWGLLAFYCLVIAFPVDGRRPPPLAPRRLLLCAASGAALGMAFGAKESGLLPAVPLGLFMLSRAFRIHGMRALAEGVALCLGLALVFAAQTAFISQYFGKWTTQYTVTTSSYTIPVLVEPEQADTPASASEPGAAVQAEQPKNEQPDLMSRFVERIIKPRAAMIVEALSGFLPWPALLLLTLSLAVCPFIGFYARWNWIVVAWTAGYLLFGSVSYRQYTPPPFHARYFGMLAGFAALNMAAAVEWLIGSQLLNKVYAGARQAAWLPGFLIALAAMAVCAANLVKGLPLTGTPYAGRQYASFIEAFNLARQQYPGYPVVLSDFFGTCMGQLFLDKRQPDLYFRNTHDKQLKELQIKPPFLVLAPLNKPTFSGDIRSVASIGPDESLSLRDVMLVQPHPNRVTEVTRSLSGWLTVPAVVEPRPAQLYPTAVILATAEKPGPAGRTILFDSARDRMPIVGQAAHPFEQTRDGINIHFDKDGPRSAEYFFFDPDPKSAPQCLLGRFDPVRGTFGLRLRLLADLPQLPPTLRVWLYLYRNGRLVWSGSAQVAPKSGVETTMEVSTPGELEADAYRVVLGLSDIAPAAGSFRIGGLELAAK